mgnify:CR=1 FL=1
MALSDLAVFSEYAYDAMTEVLAQQVELFNEASAGTINLSAAAHQGDYSERAFYAKISGLVRRRNAYGSGAVSPVNLEHLVDTMVKVAAGTPPVQLDPGQFRWIQQNPEVAGAAMGQQLAKDALADMLNTSVAATSAALANVAAVTNDISAGSDGAELPSFTALSNTAMKFGDYNGLIAAWVLHSTVLGKLYNNALTNAQQLFTYGTVNVIGDPFGRRFVVSDVPGLVVAGSPTKYRTLGLVPGAVVIDQNNDFEDNYETSNGDENIQRTYQAEWSFQLGIKGFSWDKSNGGKSPNDAAILTATNWDRYATSHKDLAGVVLISQ